MNIILSLSIFVVFCLGLSAQQITVVSSGDGEVVPYYACFDSTCNVFLGMGDSQGKLIIKNEKVILLRALGYKEKRIKLLDLESQKIELEPDFIQLPEVTVKYRKKSWMGPKSKKSKCGYVSRLESENAYSAGVYFQNSDTIFLNSVSLFVTKDSRKGALFRVRIYGVSTEAEAELDSLPELTLQSKIYEVSCRKCWQQVDLPHTIEVYSGFLVCVEWLPEDVTEGRITLDNRKVKGLVLGSSEADSCTTYTSLNYGSWRQMCCGKSANAIYNLMLRIHFEK